MLRLLAMPVMLEAHNGCGGLVGVTSELQHKLQKPYGQKQFENDPEQPGFIRSSLALKL